ncbi:hypothetical protein BGZ60DRAFT_133431 [Tricladium varicosporioides]|nr:hypothetical protein BGZ60DRAFT_133431 [Hymenoscyphus varicosporioides]
MSVDCKFSKNSLLAGFSCLELPCPSCTTTAIGTFECSYLREVQRSSSTCSCLHLQSKKEATIPSTHCNSPCYGENEHTIYSSHDTIIRQQPPNPVINSRNTSSNSTNFLAMPPKMKRESSIPLVCSLCPKSPQFSDISHLLTHISSKSHLAAKFKLQIRAQAEPEARDQLECYEFWYSTNNLDGLLSERLAIKEQKKAAKDRKTRQSGATISPVGTWILYFSFGALISNPLFSKVKKEEPGTESALQRTPFYRAPIPRMHLWPTRASGRASTPGDDEWIPGSIYETPTATRKLPNFEKQDHSVAPNMLDPKLTTPFKGDSELAEEKLTDSAKLKGIVWPGMNIFDSATPEMKRMRNQRKDGNVLEQMIALAAEVKSDEISYFPNGALRGSRDIFGPLSGENSPVLEPSPKKRRARKPTFSDVSINAPRLRASRTRKTTPVKSPEKRHVLSMQEQEFLTPGKLLLTSRPQPILNPLAAFGQHYAPIPEQDEEFRMTIGGDTRQKRTFGVFQDGPEISPGRTESSLEDHRFDFPSHSLPVFQTSSTYTSTISPTPAPKVSAIRLYGKENGMPDMQNQQQTRRQVPAMNSSYREDIFSPDFNPLFMAGYGSSTYSYNEHQTSFSEQLRPSGYASSFQGEFRQVSMNRTPGTRAPPSNSQKGAGPGSGTHYGM